MVHFKLWCLVFFSLIVFSLQKECSVYASQSIGCQALGSDLYCQSHKQGWCVAFDSPPPHCVAHLPWIYVQLSVAVWSVSFISFFEKLLLFFQIIRLYCTLSTSISLVLNKIIHTWLKCFNCISCILNCSWKDIKFIRSLYDMKGLLGIMKILNTTTWHQIRADTFCSTFNITTHLPSMQGMGLSRVRGGNTRL